MKLDRKLAAKARMDVAEWAIATNTEFAQHLLQIFRARVGCIHINALKCLDVSNLFIYIKTQQNNHHKL